MLLEFIKKKGYTRKQFAKLACISESSLDKILAENQNNIKFDTAYKIYALTGIQPWDYIEGLETLKLIHRRYLKTKKQNKNNLSTV